jgi:hypothetical protein
MSRLFSMAVRVAFGLQPRFYDVLSRRQNQRTLAIEMAFYRTLYQSPSICFCRVPSMGHLLSNPLAPMNVGIFGSIPGQVR